MTILVTGGAGFIGSYVTKKLLERGDEVVVVDDFNDYYDPQLKEDRIKKFLGDFNFKLYRDDIRDLKAMRRIFKENEIQKVCHLAARAGVRASLENPLLYEEVNVRGTMNLLELAKDFSVENFTFASSSSVYGNNKKIPFSETDSVDHPISPYAATKKATELIAYTYHHLYNLNCTGLRYFTVYGPWGRPDMALYKFANKIAKNEIIDVYNFGKMKRDFTYVDDIVEGTVAALDKNCPYEVINLGNNRPVELKHFISCIERELGKKAKMNLMPIQPGDVPETYADIEKAKKLLGFEPKIKIEEGTRKFIKWYRSYHKL